MRQRQECDHCLTKKQELHASQKAKVFAIMLGECTELMRNRVESTAECGNMEVKKSGVARSLVGAAEGAVLAPTRRSILVCEQPKHGSSWQ